MGEATPHTADAVVIGGGIIGICTALQLQRTGRRVTIIERHEPAEEASGHNGGVFSVDCLPTGTPGVIRSVPHMLVDPLSPMAIRWRQLPRIAPWLVRFALASRATRVESISAALGNLTTWAVKAYEPLVEGTDAAAILGNHGLLHVYRSAESFARARFELDLRTRRGVNYELLDAAQIARLSPECSDRFYRGVYFPQARFTTDPQAFAQVLLERFVTEGGRLLQAEAHRFATAGQRVTAVLTDDGHVAAGAVVVCAGPWSRRLARQMGLPLPLGVERGYGLDLPQPGVALSRATILADLHVSVSPHRGGIRIVGLDELADVSAPPRLGLAQRLVRAARLAFPELNLSGATTWMRQRPSMPDSLPVIGRVPGVDNAYLAFGHGHKGLGTAAITGQLIRELMDGKPTTIDVSPFRPTRFSMRSRSATSASTARSTG
jgi:D-amino-acid dehydrogenase